MLFRCFVSCATFCIQQGNFPEFSHVRKIQFFAVVETNREVDKAVNRVFFYNHQKVSVQSFSYVPKIVF